MPHELMTRRDVDRQLQTIDALVPSLQRDMEVFVRIFDDVTEQLAGIAEDPGYVRARALEIRTRHTRTFA